MTNEVTTTSATGEPKQYYAGTDKTAQEWVDLYGTNPDGSPAMQAAPDTPACPPLAASEGPFNTTEHFPGCDEPLTAEQAAYLNTVHGHDVAPPPEEGGEATRSNHHRRAAKSA